MKISVNVQLNYNYSVEIPEEIDGERVTIDDVLFVVDSDDPVYSDLCKVLRDNRLDYMGETISLIDEETGETIWAE